MNRNPLKLQPKTPDKNCNARTPRGYCRNRAGYKTPHVGAGRCWVHGGLTPSGIRRGIAGEESFNVQTIYTQMLPTSLAEELVSIKHDPMFSTLFNEYALLKMIVQSLLNNLPVDLSQMYGKPVCEECKEKYDPSGKKFYIAYKSDWAGDQKRLDKLVSTIESMSRVFEKISKHEERQQKYILVSELEQLMLRWGKVLMKHLGDDSRISAIQDEIMRIGFIRRPGDDDAEKLELFQELQKTVKNEYSYRRHTKKEPITIAQAVAKVYPELLDANPVQDADVVETKPAKKRSKKRKKSFDATKFLKNNKRVKK